MKVNTSEAILDYLVWLKVVQEKFQQNQHARDWIPMAEAKLLSLLRCESECETTLKALGVG